MQESKPSDLNLTAFHVKWWVLTSSSPRGSQIKPHHVLLSQAGEREDRERQREAAVGLGSCYVGDEVQVVQVLGGLDPTLRCGYIFGDVVFGG